MANVLTQEQVNDAFRQMGPKFLRRDLRDEWTPDNPTRNYCYVVAEFVYWYLAPPKSMPMELKLPGERAPHRFVMTVNGEIIDYAAEQFPFKLTVDEHYRHAKPKMFLQTGVRGPSARARQLAELLGFDPENPKNLLTHTPAASRVAPQRSTVTEKERSNNMLIGKYKGHEIRGEPVEVDGKDGIKIVSWITEAGKEVPQKTAKGIVGNTFKSVSGAGREIYVRMNRDYGFPENLQGRHLKFAEEGEGKRSAKAEERETKPTKARESKRSRDEETAPAKQSRKTERAAANAPASKSDSAKSGTRRSKKGDSGEAGDDSPASRPSRKREIPLITRYADQSDLAEGEERFWCNGCMAAFVGKKSRRLPRECTAAGHTYDSEGNVTINESASVKTPVSDDEEDDAWDLFDSLDSDDDKETDAEEDDDSEDEGGDESDDFDSLFDDDDDD